MEALVEVKFDVKFEVKFEVIFEATEVLIDGAEFTDIEGDTELDEGEQLEAPDRVFRSELQIRKIISY